MTDLYLPDPARGRRAPALVDALDLTGFEVETRDGHRVGSIAPAGGAQRGSWLPVESGFWIFAKHQRVASRLVVAIDVEARTVTLTLDRDGWARAAADGRHDVEGGPR